MVTVLNRISKDLKKSHEAFLADLPTISRRSLFIRVLVVGLVGLAFSIVLVTVALILTKYEPQKSDNFEFLITIIAQDFPIFLLVLLLFYKNKIKEIPRLLLPKKSTKSFLLIIAALLLIMIVGLIINLSVFAFNFIKNPQILTETLGWLEDYIGKGAEKITPEYLLLFSQSFLILFFVAFFEEIVFRFTIFRFLRKHGLMLALVLTTLLFTLIHGKQGFLATIVPAIIFALYYEYTNYFLGAVLIHLFHNLLGVYYSYYLFYLLIKLLQ